MATDDQETFAVLESNAQSYFRALSGLMVDGIDRHCLTHEAAIAALLATASVIAGEIPGGDTVLETKAAGVVDQMRSNKPPYDA